MTTTQTGVGFHPAGIPFSLDSIATTIIDKKYQVAHTWGSQSHMVQTSGNEEIPKKKKLNWKKKIKNNSIAQAGYHSPDSSPHLPEVWNM